MKPTSECTDIKNSLDTPALSGSSADPWKGYRGESKSYTPQFNVYQNFLRFDVIREISRILSQTFGPHGSTTIIEDLYMRHTATKDGYTVLKNLTSSNNLERVILELVKRVSLRLVRTVGDGTTSAIVVSAAIATELEQFMKDYPEVYSGELNKAITLISETIQDEIAKRAKVIDVDSPELHDVICISTNNDTDTADLITDVYKSIGKHGVIHVQQGDTPTTEVEFKTGFEMYRGYIDPMFVNKRVEDNEFCELENVNIMMVEGNVGRTDIEALAKVIDFIFSNNDGAFVLIACGFTPEVRDWARKCILNSKATGAMPICFCEHGVGTKDGRNHFGDVAAYTGSRVVQFLSSNESIGKCFLDSAGNINVAEVKSRLGFAKRVVVKELSTSFFEGKGKDSEEISVLKSELQHQIDFLGNTQDHYDYDSAIAKLKVRLGRLQAQSAIINVGGSSKAEIDAKAYLVDDAVLAARSALNFGVSPAGNIMPAVVLTPEVRASLEDKIVSEHLMSAEAASKLVSFIRTAFIHVFMIVSKLSKPEVEQMIADGKILNVRTGDFEDLTSTHVLHSARTDKEIIRGALSVVSLISSSNQFVFYPAVVDPAAPICK